ncbi:COX15/CtaA family protein [Ferrimicrobium sp.]|uniref:COX15/CtaA family protein n=1 Tax=Ferrimicrobium sp. TaxID=2926050 RepID=UPI00260F2280|nr:COX15/CtaA family protein [Ferrimicrobium sp.]
MDTAASDRSFLVCPTIVRRVSLIALIATYLLVVLGSTVRVTHSGMGCRSWPLCNGHLAPIDNFHSAMEQFHRYIAAIVSVLVFYTGYLAWRHARHLRSVFVPALISCGIILVQVVLGAITVLTHNAPITVGMHLVTGLIELGIVTVVATAAFIAPTRATGGPTHTTDSYMLRLAITGVLATLAIIITGAFVVDSGAAKACPGWPVCSFNAAPARLIVAQFLHRGMVAIGGLAIAVVLLRAWRNWRSLGAGPLIVFDATMFLVQVVAGAFSAVLKAPPGVQDLHLAIGAIFWMGMVALATFGWVHKPDHNGINGSPDIHVDVPAPRSSP